MRGVKGHGWNSWARSKGSFGGDSTTEGLSTRFGVLPQEGFDTHDNSFTRRSGDTLRGRADNGKQRSPNDF